MKILSLTTKNKKVIRQYTSIASILLIIVFGIKLMISSHADSPSSLTSAQSGVVNCPASTQNDSSSSNGKYIKFGEGCSVKDNLMLGATLTSSTNLVETLPSSILNSAVRDINISLDNNGTTDPEPSPGVYDWSSLDSRMDQVNQLAATNPNLIISMRVYEAPCWMESDPTACESGTKEPVSSATYNGVSDYYYQQYADLIVAAAKRYPEIKYFAIWNELAGYRPTDNWDIQDYTTMYNTVYTALKSYNPSLQVGGPYDPFGIPTNRGSGQFSLVDPSAETAMTYWLQNKAGADFIAIDGRTAGVPPATPTDPVGDTALFSEVSDWIKSQPGYNNQPIWWMEWYARPSVIPTTEITAQPEWNAISTYSLMQMVNAGANMSIIWDAENNGNPVSTPGLWSCSSYDTNNNCSGIGTTGLDSVYNVLQSELYQTNVTLSSPTIGVEVLGNATNYIAVDIDGNSHSINILGKSLTLQPWQIVTN